MLKNHCSRIIEMSDLKSHENHFRQLTTNASPTGATASVVADELIQSQPARHRGGVTHACVREASRAGQRHMCVELAQRVYFLVRLTS